MKYLLDGKEINLNDFVKKKTIIHYTVDEEEFDTKQEAKKYLLSKIKPQKIEKEHFVSYVVLYDFTLDKELGKPELISEIYEYSCYINWWLNWCKKYINKKNYREGYETQDGRKIGYIMRCYKKLPKGELELL